MEFQEILKNLPHGKAAGPSGIHYEMLKKLSKEGKTIIRTFFNCLLKTGLIPGTWKQSTIFPIPKPKPWQCDLANTRPIVLLETTRKCFTKIITNRLSSICKKYNILRGPNFAGLPGESTAEPIQLLNNICEDARENKKELWILFQDTAKAYDTVSLEMLERAMKRIHIPAGIIQIINNLFHKRQFKIITHIGLTNQITARDGIDQGETISPLLWRIFYDPLLCKIQENRSYGYTMQVKWKPNMKNSEQRELSIRHAAVAFMDDTTWIARSKEDMENILEDARFFYKANDSQINTQKSILITINNKSADPGIVHAGTTQEPVIEIDRSKHTRFLGIWLGNHRPVKDIRERIKTEINTITTVLRKKKVTEKHVLYILNRVLISYIELEYNIVT